MVSPVGRSSPVLEQEAGLQNANSSVPVAEVASAHIPVFTLGQSSFPREHLGLQATGNLTQRPTAETKILIRETIDQRGFPESQRQIRQGDESFIKRDYDEAESCYSHALKLLQSSDEAEKILHCLCQIASIYLNSDEGSLSQRRVRLVQAAGIYNYCLRAAPEKEEEFRAKLLDIEQKLLALCGGRKMSRDDLASLFDLNREALASFRGETTSDLSRLQEDPCPEEVFACNHKIAERVKSFARQLVHTCIKHMGKPPCTFALIGFGSLAREECTPYSDLEFGILVNESNKRCKEYFRNLSSLMHLRVVNLGETILPALNIPCLQRIHFNDYQTPRGFAFDGEGVDGKGSKTPFGNRSAFELIQTPEGMAQYIGRDEKGDWWFQKEPHLPMELLNFTWICGSIDLVDAYQVAIEKVLALPVDDIAWSLREYLATCHLREADELNFDPTLGNPEQEGLFVRVKQDLYRFPQLFIDRLALLLKVRSYISSERLKALQGMKIITIGTEKNMQWLIANIMWQRLRVYSHQGKQCELMNPLLSPFSSNSLKDTQNHFALNPRVYENLERVYQILIPFALVVSEFLKGNFSPIASKTLAGQDNEIRARVAMRLQQYERARDLYLLAVDARPNSPSISNGLGMVFYRLGEFPKALEFVERGKRLYEKCHRANHTNVAASLNVLGMIYASLGEYEKALECLRQSVDLYVELLGKRHLDVARCQSDLGYVMVQSGRHRDGLENSMKSFQTRKRILGENHIDTATCLNHVGLALIGLGEHEEALRCQVRSMKIVKGLLPEEHPMIATALNNIGMCLFQSGEFQAALVMQSQGLRLRLTICGENHPEIASSYSSIAKTLAFLDDHPSACRMYLEAIKVRNYCFGDYHLLTARDFVCLGECYEALSKYSDAQNCYQTALKIYENLPERCELDIADCYCHIATVCALQSNLEGDWAFQMKALQVRIEKLGDEHPKISESCFDVGETLQVMHRDREALNYFYKAFAILSKNSELSKPDPIILCSKIRQSCERLGKESEIKFWIHKERQIEGILQLRREDREVNALLVEAMSDAVEFIKNTFRPV